MDLFFGVVLGVFIGLLVNIRNSLPRCRICLTRPHCLCVKSRV